MKRKKSFNLVTSLIALVVLMGAIAFVYAFINNGQQPYYVGYGSLSISSKVSGIALPPDSYSVFYVKNLIPGQGSDYELDILPEASAPKFDFYVDGQSYPFASESDLKPAFNIIKAEGYFAIYYSSAMTPASMLESLFAGKHTVSGVPDVDLTAADYFLILVSFPDGTVIKISFRLGGDVL